MLRSRPASWRRPASPCNCQSLFQPLTMPTRCACTSPARSASMRRASQAPSCSGCTLGWPKCGLPAWRRGAVNKSTIAPTMALSGPAGASMRLPPGARSEIIALSSMAASCRALSQRASRRSRSASIGARSSVSPSISMPRLSSQAPSRSGSCSFCTVRGRSPSGPSTSLPTKPPVSGEMSSRQRCTGTLSWAKPGCTTTLQPSARNRGICSAQKSPKCASCASVQTGPSVAAAARCRHCSLALSTGTRPSSQTRSMASASAVRLRCMRMTGPPVSNRSCTGAGRAFSTELGAGVCHCAAPGRPLSGGSTR